MNIKNKRKRFGKDVWVILFLFFLRKSVPNLFMKNKTDKRSKQKKNKLMFCNVKIYSSFGMTLIKEDV